MTLPMVEVAMMAPPVKRAVDTVAASPAAKKPCLEQAAKKSSLEPAADVDAGGKRPAVVEATVVDPELEKVFSTNSP